MIRTGFASALALGGLLTMGLATAGLTTRASGADLPSKVAEPEFERPPPIPVFSWTGLYLGVHAGYAFGRDSAFATTAPFIGATTYGYSPNGIIGGGHVGYNYAAPGVLGGNALVLGIEGDADGSSYRRAFAPVGGLFAGDSTSTQANLQGSVRGRLGVAVNRMLFYATGGAAFAAFDTRYNTSATFGPGAVDAFSRTRVGYTVGGGVEYAFMNNFSVRAEYRYTNYGTMNDPLTASAPGLGVTVNHHETDNRVQAGVSYKFDTIVPAGVVARY